MVEGLRKWDAKKPFAAAFKVMMGYAAIVQPSAKLGELPAQGAFLGNLMHGAKVTSRPFLLPIENINDLVHIYFSGTTGGGKSSASRALVEEALLREIGVVIFDLKKGEWTGLAEPAPQGSFKERWEMISREAVRRGFPIAVHREWNASAGQTLPAGCTVFDLGETLDTDKSHAFETIYNALDFIDRRMRYWSPRLTERVKLLVLFEDSHRLLEPEADRCLEKMRKIMADCRAYGICFVLLSTSLRLFSHRMASLRGLINTRLFFRASDEREWDYLESCTSPVWVEENKKLRTGEAIAVLKGFEPMKVFIRPPMSNLMPASSPKAMRSKLSELDPDEQRFVQTIITLRREGKRTSGLQIRKAGNFSGEKFYKIAASLKGKGLLLETKQGRATLYDIPERDP